MQLAIETFTPDRCKRDLEAANGSNFRVVRTKEAMKYAKDMQKKRWHLNGETIKYNSRRILVDGQHRLSAGVISGVSFESLVVYGVDDFSAIDGGLRRTLPQWLRHKGYKDPVKLATVVNHCLSIASSCWSSNASTHSVDESMQWLSKYETRVIESLSMASNTIGWGLIAPIVFHGTWKNFKSPRDSELATYFASKLKTGEDLSFNDPVFRLREKLLEERVSKAIRLRPNKKRALAIVAWNKMCDGEACQVLRWSPRGGTSFPEITDAEV